MTQVHAFKGYVLKVASRCNLNCTYCYMYNLADQRWRLQPKQMSQETLVSAVERIRDHSLLYGLRRVKIGLHGGEPLLVGAQRLDQIIATIQSILGLVGIKVRITIQTNGLLFNDLIGEVITRRSVSIGVSLDGIPAINDRYRVDHKGNGSSARLEPKLRLLSSKYKDVFTGLLCVVNPASDPGETFEYLASFDPPAINFLLPLNHHDNRPVGKESDLTNEVYGRWLAEAFDCWASHPKPIRVLMYNSLINLLCGRHSITESHGLDPAELAVIETNGDIEAVDSLKATHEFATALGLNVADNDLDEAYRAIVVPAVASGIELLPPKCRSCDLVSVCGGGDLATRYSQQNGFKNVSVYCADYAHLINHIQGRLSAVRAWQSSRSARSVQPAMGGAS